MRRKGQKITPSRWLRVSLLSDNEGSRRPSGDIYRPADLNMTRWACCLKCQHCLEVSVSIINSKGGPHICRSAVTKCLRMRQDAIFWVVFFFFFLNSTPLLKLFRGFVKTGVSVWVWRNCAEESRRRLSHEKEWNQNDSCSDESPDYRAQSHYYAHQTFSDWRTV